MSITKRLANYHNDMVAMRRDIRQMPTIFGPNDSQTACFGKPRTTLQTQMEQDWAGEFALGGPI